MDSEKPTLSNVTERLVRWRAGEGEALEELMPLLYPQLRRLAQRAMIGERREHTLQPTALLHEAFLRLSRALPDLQSRAHFFAIMARTMRRVLVDHARRLSTDRRGGGQRAPLREDAAATAPPALGDLVDLDTALDELASADSRKAKVIELRFFTGLSVAETAELLRVSKPTVVLDTRLAREWLFARMTRRRKLAR